METDRMLEVSRGEKRKGEESSSNEENYSSRLGDILLCTGEGNTVQYSTVQFSTVGAACVTARQRHESFVRLPVYTATHPPATS